MTGSGSGSPCSLPSLPSLGRSQGDSPQPAPRCDTPPPSPPGPLGPQGPQGQWPLWPPLSAQLQVQQVAKQLLRPAQSHAQTSSTDLLQLVESSKGAAVTGSTAATTSTTATSTATTASTAKSRSLQFSFPCTRATKSPSPKLEKARSAEAASLFSQTVPTAQPAQQPQSLPPPTMAPATLPAAGDADRHGGSPQPHRARSNTLARHTKVARGRPALATHTLPNPKTRRARRRSTTLPDAVASPAGSPMGSPRGSPRAGSPPLTLQQVAEYLARVTLVQNSSSSTRSKHRSKSPKSFAASTATLTSSPSTATGTASAGSGLASLLSSAALSYSAGYLDSPVPLAPVSYSPPQDYSEYSPSDLRPHGLGPPHMYAALAPPSSSSSSAPLPSLPCPSEYQEPIIDPPPPPLPPPNYLRAGLGPSGLGLDPEPDTDDDPELDFLDTSVEDFEESPPAPALFADYLDFTSSVSRGKSSRSSHPSTSPRTPDSGLHATDYSPEPVEHVPDVSMLRARHHSLPAPVPVHAAVAARGVAARPALPVASPSLALSVTHSHAFGRPSVHAVHGMVHGVQVPGSSLDACGLCATLGQPWVDICRAIRASKTK